jgi:hypothetical protein
LLLVVELDWNRFKLPMRFSGWNMSPSPGSNTKRSIEEFKWVKALPNSCSSTFINNLFAIELTQWIRLLATY